MPSRWTNTVQAGSHTSLASLWAILGSVLLNLAMPTHAECPLTH